MFQLERDVNEGRKKLKEDKNSLIPSSFFFPSFIYPEQCAQMMRVEKERKERKKKYNDSRKTSKQKKNKFRKYTF